MTVVRSSHSAGTGAFSALSKRLGKQWHSINQAAADAAQKRQQFLDILGNQKVGSDDLSIVAFGSLARDEWTAKSDVDWTLLIDGGANSDHLLIAQWIASQLDDAGFAKPGPTGVFGNMAFSHDIVHQIGGQQDTNRNTTQRILILLESVPIGNESAYERVLRAVLNRYLEDDLSYLSPEGEGPKVPRFLLNDVVRFWRTMAVDYASKHRERAGEGWALRNAKLRMSRKLIFASGLLACFSCVLKPSVDVRDSLFGPERSFAPLVNHLYSYVSSTPLEIVAQAWLDHPNDEAATQMFDAYDSFLSLLNNEEKREHLKRLKQEASKGDPIFQQVREIGHAFQDALTRLFFDTPAIFKLVKTYGVF